MLPWLFIPLLLLTSVQYFDGGGFWGTHSNTLFLPFAAWLGFRYRGEGVKAVFVASVILSFKISMAYNLPKFGMDTGTLLTGLGLAWLFSATENWARFRGTLQTHRQIVWLLILMPVGLQFFLSRKVSVTIGGGLMVYAAFFVLGFLGMRKRLLLAPLLFMCVLSAGTTALYVFQMDLGLQDWPVRRFSYAFVNELNLIEAILFFFTGAWTTHFLTLREQSLEYSRYGFPALLILLFLYSTTFISIHEPCSVLGRYAPCDIELFDPLQHLVYLFPPPDIFEFFLTGGYYSLLIASFLAGLVYRMHGIWIVLVLLIACGSLGSFIHIRSHSHIVVLGEFVLAAEFRGLFEYRTFFLSLFFWVFVGNETRKNYHAHLPVMAKRP